MITFTLMLMITYVERYLPHRWKPGGCGQSRRQGPGPAARALAEGTGEFAENSPNTSREVLGGTLLQ
jgi:hypothetical protein